MEKLSETREMMEFRIDLISKCVNQAGIVVDWDFREYLRLDILRFLLCVCNADGEIPDKELDFIKYLFDYHLTQEEWREYMHKERLDDSNFLRKVPYTLDFVIDAENAKIDSNFSLSKTYVELFDELGHRAIDSDRVCTTEELKIRNEYIDFLWNYTIKKLDRKWKSRSLKTRQKEDAEYAELYHDFKKTDEISNLIKSVKELVGRVCLNQPNPDWNWEGCAEQAIKELEDFILCIACANGKIGSAEATFIRTYFDPDADSFSLQKAVDEKKINPQEFLESRSFPLFRLIQYDKACQYHSKKKVGLLYIRTFELVGESFLLCGGEVGKKELDVYKNYINRLRSMYSESFPKICSPNMTLSPELQEAAFKYSIKTKSSTIGKSDGDESLSDLLEELHSLVGLATVKRDVDSLIRMQKIQQDRERRGLKTISTTNHLVFYGNPGTGKTTVARLIAKIYRKMGIIRKDEIIEVDRSKLVGGYVGQTALKVQEVVKEALGGVLFIDEAYTLTQKAGSDDYGQEAVDTLLKAMEDHRDDLIVIVAGYPVLMNSFIASNPGLASRFNKYIHFEDYLPDELLEIFKGMCKKNGYYPNQEALDIVEHILIEKYNNRDENFSNAREVRNLFETIITNQACRLFDIAHPSSEELMLIVAEDVAPLVE